MIFSDEYFMNEALKEAQKAYDKKEVPVGAVIVSNNKIIARAHNLTERLTDVTAHAEMQAFTAASNYLGGKYLTDCILYVTLEPCVMCTGAACWTRISRIVFGVHDEKRGFSKYSNDILHPATSISNGCMANDCADLLKKFFKERRKS